MAKFVMSSAVLLMLAACGGYGGANTGSASGATASSDGNEEVVCDQQSRWAQSGKIDGGNITITCPGNARPAY